MESSDRIELTRGKSEQQAGLIFSIAQIIRAMDEEYLAEVASRFRERARYSHPYLNKAALLNAQADALETLISYAGKLRSVDELKKKVGSAEGMEAIDSMFTRMSDGGR